MEKLEKYFLTNQVNSLNLSAEVKTIILDIIFQHIKDMVFIMKVDDGPKFRYLFVNQAGLDHANLEHDFIGKTFDEVLHPQKAIILQREYERILQVKQKIVFSDVIELPNGRNIAGESFLTPVFDEKNEVRFVVAITRDITDTLKEKQLLIESEQKYRSIVDHNLDGIFTVNLKGTILEVNPAVSQLTGIEEKQLESCSILDFIADQDVDNFKVIFDRTMNGYPCESLDCRFKHKNGRHLTIHLKTAPVVVHSQIIGMYVIVRDITEQARNAETIKYMAFHDQLTGLLNRRALLQDLEIRITKTEKNKFALISIDIDRFKHLNDTLGHIVGDQILTKVADRLSELKNCTVYRQGGDEFILILPEADRENVSKFAQSILSLFSHSFYFNSQEYYITPSIGISMYPSDGNTAETLLKNADEALFRVKQKGKAHYQFYRSEMNSFLPNVVEMETLLRKALEREELTLYYQPQINLSTNKINSFEALIRWNCPSLGLVSPSDFIPLAEDTGLIIPIGNWVIEEACKQIQKWSDMSSESFRIAVNISPKQFQEQSLLPVIQRSIELYQINSNLLEIEITEGVMQDTRIASQILYGLKDLGVTISVDDFGTGYSSLNYIKKFPIDVLKIDKSFVKDVLSNEKDEAITTTIIHLGRSLGMEVIAEGVELEEQAQFLIQANCHKAQGFLFSKPLQADEVEKNFIKDLSLKKSR